MSSVAAVSAGGPYSVAEGSSIVLTAFGSDPDDDPVSYAWDLDNNGSFETPGLNVNFSAAGLDGPSTRIVAVLATDPDGASAAGSATVTVVNVAPTVGAITAPLAPQSIGTPIAVSVSFTDPGALDTFACSIQWGDGAETAGSIAADVCSASHVYTSAGVYSLDMTVQDDDEGAGTSTFRYVVIYTGSGFVTGGGRIDSPVRQLR